MYPENTNNNKVTTLTSDMKVKFPDVKATHFRVNNMIVHRDPTVVGCPVRFYQKPTISTAPQRRPLRVLKNRCPRNPPLATMTAEDFCKLKVSLPKTSSISQKSTTKSGLKTACSNPNSQKASSGYSFSRTKTTRDILSKSPALISRPVKSQNLSPRETNKKTATSRSPVFSVRQKVFKPILKTKPYRIPTQNFIAKHTKNQHSRPELPKTPSQPSASPETKELKGSHSSELPAVKPTNSMATSSTQTEITKTVPSCGFSLNIPSTNKNSSKKHRTLSRTPNSRAAFYKAVHTRRAYKKLSTPRVWSTSKSAATKETERGKLCQLSSNYRSPKKAEGTKQKMPSVAFSSNFSHRYPTQSNVRQRSVKEIKDVITKSNDLICRHQKCPKQCPERSSQATEVNSPHSKDNNSYDVHKLLDEKSDSQQISLPHKNDDTQTISNARQTPHKNHSVKVISRIKKDNFADNCALNDENVGCSERTENHNNIFSEVLSRFNSIKLDTKSKPSQENRKDKTKYRLRRFIDEDYDPNFDTIQNVLGNSSYYHNPYQDPVKPLHKKPGVYENRKKRSLGKSDNRSITKMQNPESSPISNPTATKQNEPGDGGVTFSRGRFPFEDAISSQTDNSKSGTVKPRPSSADAGEEYHSRYRRLVGWASFLRRTSRSYSPPRHRSLPSSADRSKGTSRRHRVRYFPGHSTQALHLKHRDCIQEADFTLRHTRQANLTAMTSDVDISSSTSSTSTSSSLNLLPSKLVLKKWNYQRIPRQGPRNMRSPVRATANTSFNHKQDSKFRLNQRQQEQSAAMNKLRAEYLRKVPARVQSWKPLVLSKPISLEGIGEESTHDRLERIKAEHERKVAAAISNRVMIAKVPCGSKNSRHTNVTKLKVSIPAELTKPVERSAGRSVIRGRCRAKRSFTPFNNKTRRSSRKYRKSSKALGSRRFRVKRRISSHNPKSRNVILSNGAESHNLESNMGDTEEECKQPKTVKSDNRTGSKIIKKDVDFVLIGWDSPTPNQKHKKRKKRIKNKRSLKQEATHNNDQKHPSIVKEEIEPTHNEEINYEQLDDPFFFEECGFHEKHDSSSEDEMPQPVTNPLVSAFDNFIKHSNSNQKKKSSLRRRQSNVKSVSKKARSSSRGHSKRPKLRKGSATGGRSVSKRARSKSKGNSKQLKLRKGSDNCQAPSVSCSSVSKHLGPTKSDREFVQPPWNYGSTRMRANSAECQPTKPSSSKNRTRMSRKPSFLEVGTITEGRNSFGNYMNYTKLSNSLVSL